MDPRHESLKEGFLNHVIMTINSYILDNIDTLVQDNNLHDQIQEICNRIYLYLDVDVDIEAMLSKRNLLSTDVVLFPPIPDPEGNTLLNDAEFRELILEIKKIIVTNNKNDKFRNKIADVIEDYGV